MTTTLIAVYENAEAAGQAVRAVQERGLAREVTVLGRRQDGPEQGTNPVITGPGYGQSAPEMSPPEGEPGLGRGAAVGATLGGTLGMLASTYVVPGVGPLTQAAPLVSTLVGAGVGSFLGALIQSGAAEDTEATLYAGTVRLGGVLVAAVCEPDRVAECRAALEGWGALELREHPGGPVGEAENTRPALTNRGGREPGPAGTSQAPGQVAGGLALTGGAREQTGRTDAARADAAGTGEARAGRTDDASAAQPGPGGGAGLG